MKTVRVVAAVIKAVSKKGEQTIFATQTGYGRKFKALHFQNTDSAEEQY